MKKSLITKLVVQAIGACFGILGLMWIYLGGKFVFTGVRDSDLFQILYMTPIFFVLGGIVLAVSWQTLRHFGAKAIQNAVGLVAFSFYTTMIVLLRPYQDATWDLKMRIHHAATFMIPMLLAYLFYRIVSRKFIEYTTIRPTEP